MRKAAFVMVFSLSVIAPWAASGVVQAVTPSNAKATSPGRRTRFMNGLKWFAHASAPITVPLASIAALDTALVAWIHPNLELIQATVINELHRFSDGAGLLHFPQDTLLHATGMEGHHVPAGTVISPADMSTEIYGTKVDAMNIGRTFAGVFSGGLGEFFGLGLYWTRNAGEKTAPSSP